MFAANDESIKISVFQILEFQTNDLNFAVRLFIQSFALRCDMESSVKA